MGAKWQVLGGLGHGVQRARALGKCVGRGQQVKARTLAHAQHSPGAVVSLLAPSPVTSEKRLREGHKSRAQLAPATQVRPSCRVRRGSLGIHEAILRGAARRRAVAASIRGC